MTYLHANFITNDVEKKQNTYTGKIRFKTSKETKEKVPKNKTQYKSRSRYKNKKKKDFLEKKIQKIQQKRKISKSNNPHYNKKKILLILII